MDGGRMNGARGEVPLEIEGEIFRLCLTLGALAEIESGLGLASLGELEERFKRPRIGDVVIVLAALLRGGGHDVSARALAMKRIDLAAAARAIALSFSAAGLGAA